MRSVNPLIIPRNHKVEEALEAANINNLTPMKNLLKVLENPYTKQEKISEYQFLKENKNERYQTFCGT